MLESNLLSNLPAGNGQTSSSETESQKTNEPIFLTTSVSRVSTLGLLSGDNYLRPKT